MPMDPLELDVRPILRAGGEPFGEIMDAVGKLQPGQSLRLFATFRPVPLFSVMDKKGFRYNATPLPDGEWEVVFEPGDTEPAGRAATDVVKAPVSRPAPDWPEPVISVDFRDLEPPEPMVKTLEIIETMKPGEVLTVTLCREPVFLLPHLKDRGHDWKGHLDDNGNRYDLTVHVKAPVGGGAE